MIVGPFDSLAPAYSPRRAVRLCRSRPRRSILRNAVGLDCRLTQTAYKSLHCAATGGAA
jgi:hypothetical protein